MSEKRESSLVTYAKEEMERAWPEAERDEMQQFACDNVLELLRVFSEQGHSEFSGNYVLSVFNKLVRFKPLSPLTGEEDEWFTPDKHDGRQQNKRCGSIFRENGDNSTAYNSEANVFEDQDGFTFTTYLSAAPVKFPYTVPDKPNIVKVFDRRRNNDE